MGNTQDQGCCPATHVSNAYSQDVFAMVAMDIAYLTRFVSRARADYLNYGMETMSESEYVWHFAEKEGKTRIAPCSYIRFDTPKSTWSTGTVYVSIVAKDKFIARSHPVRRDGSVIVDGGGYLRMGKYGELWEDSSGRTYC